jgi:hypothetical protein
MLKLHELELLLEFFVLGDLYHVVAVYILEGLCDVLVFAGNLLVA